MGDDMRHLTEAERESYDALVERRSASPILLETMIEDLGRYGYEVEVWQEADRWYADRTAWKADGDRLSATGPTPREAIAALYAAWRERRNDD